MTRLSSTFGSRLTGFLDIRAEERRTTFAAFGTLLALTTGHTLLETARDALFLARMPAARLPWMYLVIVAFALALSRVGRSRADSRTGVCISLALAAGVTAGFWGLLRAPGPITLYALYVWTGLFASWVTVQFWTLLGRVHTLTQAKRLYGIIGAGSVLGGVLGAFLARVVISSFSPRASLLVSAALFLAAVGPCMAVSVPVAGVSGAVAAHPEVDDEIDPARRPMSASFRLLWQNAFARRVLGIALVSTITVTLADFLFKSRIAADVRSARELGEYLSNFYAVTNTLSLVAQLVVAPWVFRTLGVQRALFFFPALMGLAATGVVGSGGILGAAVALKGLDGVLRYSLHKTSTELLLVPVPDGTRERIKPMVDLLGSRGGQAIASVGILLLVAASAADPVTLGVVVLTLSVVWLALVVTIRRLYLDVFRETLKAGGLSGKAELPELDLGALETLFAGLNSSRDSEVLASLEILAEQHRERLIPALILYHPSRDVVLRALEIFQSMRRVDFASIADRLNGHPDREVAAAALRARTAVLPDRKLLEKRLDETCSQVSVTALVALMSRGWIDPTEASHRLERLGERASWQTAAELARAIRDIAGERRDGEFEELFDDMLIKIAENAASMRDAGGVIAVQPPLNTIDRSPFVIAQMSPDIRLRLEIARAMGARKSPKFLPVLVHMLSRHELRASARAALVGIAGAIEFLDGAMSDPSLPHNVRIHVPRTMSLFDAQRVVPLLESHLLPERDGAIRFKVLRALVKMRQKDPTLVFNEQVLRTAADSTLDHAAELRRWYRALTTDGTRSPSKLTVADPTHAAQHLLVDLLRDKEVHATQRVFLLLELLYREDFDDVWRGLRGHDANRRASSLELVENIVRPPLRQRILALVDVDHEEEEAAVTYEQALREIYAHDSDTMRALAEYRAVELGIDIGQTARFRRSGEGALATSIGKRLMETARDLLAPEAPQPAGGSRAPA